jgi:hypothetical protein
MNKFQIRFRDIDPDTGLNSQDILIAQCEGEEMAKWVKQSIEKEWYSENGPQDPNREFYILDCSISL